MECTIGIRFNKFVIMAADTIDARSIVVMKNDEDKFFPLSSHLLMGVTGEAGDTSQFSEYIAKNIHLYKMKNEYELSPKSAAHFTRRILAESLRSRESYKVNLLLAGFDKIEKKPELFFMDYLGSMMELPYCAHGYGAYFVLGCMDSYYKADMSENEGYELMKLCIAELGRRFSINLPSFMVKVVNENGIQDRPTIRTSNLI